MDYQKICKTENLDENKIFEIITRRRCDYIRKPPKISAEIDGETVFFRFSSIKDWENFKKRRNISGKPRAKGQYDYALRHLKALLNDKGLSEDYRHKYCEDYRQLAALRDEQRAWGKQEKRIKALQKSGKIIKKIEQVQREIVFDLLKYIEKQRKDLNLDKIFSLTARIVRGSMNINSITKNDVKTIYWNVIEKPQKEDKA